MAEKEGRKRRRLEWKGGRDRREGREAMAGQYDIKWKSSQKIHNWSQCRDQQTVGSQPQKPRLPHSFCICGSGNMEEEAERGPLHKPDTA